jgi:hypothetical protein
LWLLEEGTMKSQLLRELADIDSGWTQQRVTYMDFSREPAPLSVWSVLATLTGFILCWLALAFLENRALLTANSAVCCIVILYSMRWRQFEAAYRRYQQKRSAFLADSKTAA